MMIQPISVAHFSGWPFCSPYS